MDTSNFRSAPGSWQWPEGLDELRNRFEEGRAEPSTQVPQGKSEPESSSQQEQHQQQPKAGKKQRHWKPRTCRICLETVLPTFHPPSENIPGIFQSGPSVTYESEDGGRLLRPCKCRGTASYVHEGCLQAWRHADAGYAARNYFQCPTCSFRYRLQRMGWGRMISSTCRCLLPYLFLSLYTGAPEPITNWCPSDISKTLSCSNIPNSSNLRAAGICDCVRFQWVLGIGFTTI
jgi:hypothetical protein